MANADSKLCTSIIATTTKPAAKEPAGYAHRRFHAPTRTCHLCCHCNCRVASSPTSPSVLHSPSHCHSRPSLTRQPRKSAPPGFAPRCGPEVGGLVRQDSQECGGPYRPPASIRGTVIDQTPSKHVTVQKVHLAPIDRWLPSKFGGGGLRAERERARERERERGWAGLVVSPSRSTEWDSP